MSNTEKTHKRFWGAMAEAFGTRWVIEYGNTPTLSWSELLDRYTPADIKLALELMRARAFKHPPTQPEFAQLLAAAEARRRNATDDPAELRRGYWRSLIVNGVAHGLGYSTASFEPVLVANKDSLGASMKRLLDEVDELEVNTGQRTQGMLDHAEDTCRKIIAAHWRLRAAA